MTRRARLRDVPHGRKPERSCNLAACCASENADHDGSSRHAARQGRCLCRLYLRFLHSNWCQAITPRNKMSRRRQARRGARQGPHSDRQAARNIQHPRPRDEVCPDWIGRPGPVAQLPAGPSGVRNRSSCRAASSRPDRAHADWTIFARKPSARIWRRRWLQSRPGLGQRDGRLNVPAFAPPRVRIHTCRSCRSSDPPTFKARTLFRDASLSIRRKARAEIRTYFSRQHCGFATSRWCRHRWWSRTHGVLIATRTDNRLQIVSRTQSLASKPWTNITSSAAPSCTGSAGLRSDSPANAGLSFKGIAMRTVKPTL